METKPCHVCRGTGWRTPSTFTGRCLKCGGKGELTADGENILLRERQIKNLKRRRDIAEAFAAGRVLTAMAHMRPIDADRFSKWYVQWNPVLGPRPPLRVGRTHTRSWETK